MTTNISPSDSRSVEAQRAAQIILGSSVTSSGASHPSMQSSQTHQEPGHFTNTQGSLQDRRIFTHPSMRDESSSHPYQYQVSNTSHLRYYSGRGSRVPVPIIMTDDIVSGTQHNNRMSPVRRFFCLLVTFDVLFIALLWVMTILVTEKDLVSELRRQIVAYSIYESMFDCVLVAAIRFIMCIFGYAFLYISHWWIVATSTAGTIAFIATKVFLYHWTRNPPITYDVMLVLTSFIIAWGEVWMLDFRVLPLECKAKEIWGHHFGPNERTPLLQNDETSERMAGYADGSTLYEGSVGNFYSPVETPNHSDDEFEEMPSDCGVRIPNKFRRRKNLSLSTMESEFKKLGQDTIQEAWRSLNSNGWKIEKQMENGDSVHVKTVNGKKVFKLTGFIDIAPRLLLEELYYRIEQLATWNPTVADCRIIHSIDEHTDITYQVCAEAAGGILTTRDFVSLRHWDQLDGAYVSAGVSVIHPAMPPHQKRIRGENGAGCFAMRPVGADSDHCLFQWLLDTDLKGWVPHSIVEKALSGAQLEYINHIRKRAIFIKQGEH